MGEIANDTAVAVRRLLLVPAPRAPGTSAPWRSGPLALLAAETAARAGGEEAPDRLARREALLHRLELDRQRRRYHRSA